MLVSIIVPVFNGGGFLDECLDCLFAQDYSPIEILVVDDGSTDDSAAVAERRAGVRVIRRPHAGLPVTRNAGIEASTGALIAWLDADDTCRPDKIRLQAEYLDAHPDIDIVLCRQDTIFENGIDHPEWLFRDQVRGDLDGVAPTSGLFRREVFDRLGGFDTTMEMGTDFNVLIRARAAGVGIALIDDVLRSRRIHGNNMTTRHGTAKADMFRTVRQHLRNQSR